jgi:hypothetical protein
MNLPVTNVQVANLSCHLWVETQADGEVLAWIGEWPECRVTADSRGQAITALENRLQEQMAMRSIEVLPLQLSPLVAQHPIMKFAGIFKDDPDFAEIVAEMRAERELEADNPAYTLDW